MKVLFGVQSEGNGHVIQSLCVQEHLESRGCRVVAAFAARKPKGLARFFTEKVPVIEHEGIDIAFDAHGRVRVLRSIVQNVLKLPHLIRSLYGIIQTIRREKPDVVVNFYEPLVGVSALFLPGTRYISFGHQYAMPLAIYPKLEGFRLQKLILWFTNRSTSLRAQKVALSYYEFRDDSVIPCPPLLRSRSRSRSDQREDFVLAYLMNEELLDSLIGSAVEHPELRVECFVRTTRPYATPVNLKLHDLDGPLFQERMKTCRAVVCSGGFATSAEAMLQGKPLLMVPSPNHFEQHANCNDAQVHGLAAWSPEVHLGLLPASQRDPGAWFGRYREVLDQVFAPFLEDSPSKSGEARPAQSDRLR
jgi:uncharacterized protein (TIGR00661 family)